MMHIFGSTHEKVSTCKVQLTVRMIIVDYSYISNQFLFYNLNVIHACNAVLKAPK